jgi:hypothetical protein
LFYITLSRLFFFFHELGRAVFFFTTVWSTSRYRETSSYYTAAQLTTCKFYDQHYNKVGFIGTEFSRELSVQMPMIICYDDKSV